MPVRERIDPAVLIQIQELNDALQQAVKQARTLEERYRRLAQQYRSGRLQGRRTPASPTYQ